MMKVLAFLLAFAAPAMAQNIVGPLQAQNKLSEIAAQGSGAQATARANLGISGSGAFLPLTGGTLTGPLFAPTYNNLSITQPATGSTLTILDGKTLTVGNSLGFTGTDGTSFAFPPLSDTVFTLGQTQTASGNKTFSGTTTFGLNSTSFPVVALNVQNAIGSNSAFQFNRNSSRRWDFELRNASPGETGRNQGSPWVMSSYLDTGLGGQTLLNASRTSGNLGLGGPWFTVMAPFTQTSAKYTGPGSTYLNEVNLLASGDSYITTTLGNNPLTLSGPLGGGFEGIFVHWPGCCAPSSGAIDAGPLYIGGGTSAWVRIQGATPIDGIDFNTGGDGHGWYQVKANPTIDDFRINVLGSGTTGDTGGGASVTVQPSAPRPMERISSIATYGGGGYANQINRLYYAVPSYKTPQALAGGGTSIYQMDFHQFFGPPDTTRSNNWAGFLAELDYGNRGLDPGYDPDLFDGNNPIIGLYIPVWGDTTGAAGGGILTNTQSTLVCARYRPTAGVAAAMWVGIYNCNQISPDALVGEGFDTYYCNPMTDCSNPANHVGGHGGVGYDAFGTFARITGTYITHIGTPTVTVSSFPGQGVFVGLNNGDIINLPAIHTYDGVTFGGGEYAISNINTTTETVDITGSGNAISGGSFGVNFGEAIYIKRHTPFAETQAWGGWQHLIYLNQQINIRDGLAVHSVPVSANQPGGGFGWDDGTAIAAITGTQISAGHISIDLNSTTGDPINAGGPLRLKSYTVGALPTCNTGMKGGLVYVTDAAAVPIYNATATGAGAVVLPVFCNGTNWTNH